jgi:hypothetical protein
MGRPAERYHKVNEFSAEGEIRRRISFVLTVQG